jgi:hypothetical protein
MAIRVLDLDSSVIWQTGLIRRCQPIVVEAGAWGPRIRLGCSFRRFRSFENWLAGELGSIADLDMKVTLYGSGDFHHVSLALVRRQPGPFNLLVVDNHPDWMRGVPLVHCGTWLYHAARLPQVRRIFHVGGDVDFDNYYRQLAPWNWLRSGKITVIPARRRYTCRPWRRVAHEALRPQENRASLAVRLQELLEPFRAELSSLPLYISLDKDVMFAADAVVNWDSGHLTLADVQAILKAFLAAASGRLAGMDIVGDWSPVVVQGLLRRTLHWTEHPQLIVDPTDATRRNEETNLALVDTILACVPDRMGGQPRRSLPTGASA